MLFLLASGQDEGLSRAECRPSSCVRSLQQISDDHPGFNRSQREAVKASVNIFHFYFLTGLEYLKSNKKGLNWILFRSASGGSFAAISPNVC